MPQVETRKIISMLETIVGFLFACYASSQIYCVTKGLDAFGMCQTKATFLTTCAMIFFIPGVCLWVNKKLGILMQVVIPIGVIWVWHQLY